MATLELSIWQLQVTPARFWAAVMTYLFPDSILVERSSSTLSERENLEKLCMFDILGSGRTRVGHGGDYHEGVMLG